MRVDDLIGRARAAAGERRAEPPAAGGLVRLAGGMNHDVFAPVDDPAIVVKVFRTAEGHGASREWDALVALAGSGIAPEPVRFDPAEPATVVMTRVVGSPLAARALGRDHAVAIGRMHRRVHRVVAPTPQPPTHSGLLAARSALLAAGTGALPAARDDTSDVVRRAWSAARAWIADADLQQLLSSDRSRFSRGDPNLGNYLWGGGGLVLVDWEDSGYNDPALELADMAEHASTRALSEDFWIDLADATELTPAERVRVPDARRLLACFWLVIIEKRQRQGQPTTVTVEEQAQRTLAVLDR